MFDLEGIPFSVTVTLSPVVRLELLNPVRSREFPMRVVGTDSFQLSC